MAVERFKHDGEWKVMGSSSGKVQVSDDKLDSESINSVQNKVITKALEYKADIVNKFVNAYGIRSVSNTEYCMPDIDAGNPAHTLATKADIISNEALESKATMYNLYAMDDLTAEQLAANEAAFEAAQNSEVAVYRIYTNDTLSASADVKIVPGPYLEAFVYVNTPNADSKQATIIKYTYTFDQSGEYTTSDKEEVTLPSIDKVNELIGSGGEGGVEEVYVGTGTPPSSAKVWINPDAHGTGGGGGSIAVDDALSLESTNPVQNKVLTEALEGKVNIRYVYVGYDEKEREYNLETLNILMSSDEVVPTFEYQFIDTQLGVPFPCFLAMVRNQVGFYCDGYFKMMEANSPLYASLPAKTYFYALQEDGTLTNNGELIGLYSPTYIRGIDKSTSHYSALRNDIALNIMPCVALEGGEGGGKRSYALSTNIVHYGDKGIQIVYISKYGTKMLRIFDGTSVRDVSFPLDLSDETLRSFAFDHLKDGGCEVRNGSGMLMLKGAISDSSMNLSFFNGSNIEHYSFNSSGELTLLSTQNIG